jgi:hypothetical protein
MSNDKNVNFIGKIAKFPKNTKAHHAYNFLENIKISKKSIWYIMVENQDTELKMIKYNNKEGFDLTKFLSELKNYYAHHAILKEHLSKLEIDGTDKYSIIKNIPDVEIEGKKLISILMTDLIKLLR